MDNLQSLNNYSNNTISFTENRPANVLFSYPTARDVETVIQDQFQFVVERKIDIVEIIDPNNTLNIQFIIDVSSVTGASVNWSSLPSGVSVSGNNQIYTVNGIDSVEDWLAVAEPTVNIPEDFQGSFFYDCEIKYLTDQGLQSKQWSVGTFIPVSELESTTALIADAKLFKGMSANLDTQMSLSLVYKQVALVSFFNLTVQTINFNRTSAILSTNTSINLFSPFAVETSRTYLSNVSNQIFASDTPFIQDKNPATTANFDLTFITDENSKINRTPTDNGFNSLTYSGTLTEINSVIDDLNLYPNYAYTGQIELQWQLKKDNVLIDDGNIYFERSGSGTIAINDYTFNNSGILNLRYDEFVYGKLDVLLVGGGGGGASEGGGGGGGGFIELTNLAIANQNNTITVGTGGAANFDQPNCISAHGFDGNDTSAFGYTANGGQGGRHYECFSNNPNTTVWMKDGGRSGQNSVNSSFYLGEEESGTVGFQYSAMFGGGGGGAGQAGGTNGEGYGGDGKISTIFGSYYGGGGAGRNAPSGEETGGLGGGGNSNDINGDAVANTGGGGGNGGGTFFLTRTGNGAAGIAKIKVRPNSSDNPVTPNKTIVGSETTSGSGSTFDFVVPSQTLPGDLILVLSAARDDRNVTFPSGFIEDKDLKNDGLSAVHVGHRIADGSEAGQTFSLSPSSPGGYLNTVLTVRGGVAPSFSNSEVTIGNFVSTESIQGANNALILSFFGGRNLSTVTLNNGPSNMDLVDFNWGNGALVAISGLYTNNSLNPGNWSFSSNDNCVLVGWSIRV